MHAHLRPQGKPKIVATVECRMTSSRLPGKVMMESLGKPMLEILVERLRAVKQIDAIVLATTTNAQDDCIVELAKKLKVHSYRGSEEDVLRRVLGAADSVNAQLIVEITGDCPLLDPEIVSQTIDLYFDNPCDYAANCLKQTFPLGMETQVFSTELLRLADKDGLTPEDREHVSWYFIRNPKLFSLLQLPAPPAANFPEVRLTLDEIDDYKIIDQVYRNLYPKNRLFTCQEMMEFLKKNTTVLALNQHVKQKTLPPIEP